ncbi:hypothetical protein [Flectobacillus rivi]|uniref:Glutathionylspermidine synthase pre-ATP-grasp-like domain-containing protein n=1 Tax=Flectobacillus rivi TaxID=2984209 RepID=A0ABT6Z4L6_9BACT|nr:hypothetical protein [Flectobacillus rivi]MDI9876078.1 hypothetical protein [Flectobacillus rivi]
MHKASRKNFNAQFSSDTYQQFLASIHREYPQQLDFRVAETPVFVPESFKNQLLDACEHIISVLTSTDFKEKTNKAIPYGQNVPRENLNSSFLAIDFAICENEKGEIEPQLIELQGFPSLFAFQYFLSKQFQNQYPIPDNFDFLFNDLTRPKYVEFLRNLIVGEEKPENVILLEIYPETQKTRIDFKVTEELLGVKAICITKIIKKGKLLFYEDSGELVPIKRIYNRLIFDDLANYPGLQTAFNFTDDVDVEWVGHPNWFFRISKYILPLFNHQYIPESHYLSDFQEDFPKDLENYVLKPLFSFAGSGVKINITEYDLQEVENPAEYILQRKVNYLPVIETTDGSKVKAEIRLLYGWEQGAPKPTLLTNLARLSRGEMIGVRFNKDFDWVGGTVCFMEK